MSVAEKITAIRKQRKLSQEQLAIKCGVSQSAISLIEREERIPTVETLALIAKGLRVSVSDLLPEKATEKPAVDLSGLDDELIDLLASLPEKDVQRVKDFVSGLKASRKE